MIFFLFLAQRPERMAARDFGAFLVFCCGLAGTMFVNTGAARAGTDCGILVADRARDEFGIVLVFAARACIPRVLGIT
jgi:hypothetical protein